MYGHYAAPEISNEQKALATLSRCLDGSEIDPDGLARIHSIHVVAAEAALDVAVANGKAYKTKDGWYGPSPEFKKEIQDRLAEIEAIEAENRRKYFSE